MGVAKIVHMHHQQRLVDGITNTQCVRVSRRRGRFVEVNLPGDALILDAGDGIPQTRTGYLRPELLNRLCLTFTAS